MTTPNLRATSAYRNVGIETNAPQHDQYQLVVMMFDTTLECLLMAKGAIERSDTALKIKKIEQAIRIVQEGLRTSLDTENGGKLADNLAALYDYCVIRMTQANARNSTEALDEVFQLIKTISDAWKDMRKQGASSATLAATTPTHSSAAPQISRDPGQKNKAFSLNAAYV